MPLSQQDQRCPAVLPGAVGAESRLDHDVVEVGDGEQPGRLGDDIRVHGPAGFPGGYTATCQAVQLFRSCRCRPRETAPKITRAPSPKMTRSMSICTVTTSRAAS